MNSTLYATKGIVVKKLLDHAKPNQTILGYNDGILEEIEIDTLNDETFYTLQRNDLSILVLEVKIVDSYERLQHIAEQLGRNNYSL